ncbi:uncharacterized protein LOC120364593 [Saimiri boliviensis]|uniref:uncharacterized protein LOC120364593 n=1 Tax=Saimiri boliviensis TaxID=27679 RepID=UPI003D76ECFF
MTHSLRSSSWAYSSWTGSSHKSHSLLWILHRSHNPPWSPHRSHSPPWSPHRSHSPPWSPHRSHSCSRNRLAHSSRRACSSRQAHSSWSHSPHSRSHSSHSWSHSPRSQSHSLRSSHSSPCFWWIEGGAGRGTGMAPPSARLLGRPSASSSSWWQEKQEQARHMGTVRRPTPDTSTLILDLPASRAAREIKIWRVFGEDGSLSCAIPRTGECPKKPGLLETIKPVSAEKKNYHELKSSELRGKVETELGGKELHRP